MIYTGNYNNCKDGNIISISGDKGKSIGYNGRSFSLLAPKLSFWKEWHNNIGKISKQENDDFYILEYYKKVLANLDAREIYNQLNESVLLCYEEPLEFCHRHIVAA